MPASKTKSSTKAPVTNKKLTLSRFRKKYVVVGLVVVVVAGIGAYMTYTSNAASSKTIGDCYKTTIRQGSRNACVQTAQTILNHLLFYYMDKHHTANWGGLATDGIYGAKTYNAVIAYQRAYNAASPYDISVDGVVGPQTWQKLTVNCMDFKGRYGWMPPECSQRANY